MLCSLVRDLGRKGQSWQKNNARLQKSGYDAQGGEYGNLVFEGIIIGPRSGMRHRLRDCDEAMIAPEAASWGNSGLVAVPSPPGAFAAFWRALRKAWRISPCIRSSPVSIGWPGEGARTQTQADERAPAQRAYAANTPRRWHPRRPGTPRGFQGLKRQRLIMPGYGRQASRPRVRPQARPAAGPCDRAWNDLTLNRFSLWNLSTGKGMGERITRLEACRGIAAIIVVFWHTLIAFEPTVVGSTVDQRTSYSLSGTIFYPFIHGMGAVIFFFVLSGYVLTVKFFENPDPNLIARAVFKRLPRLAGVTTIVTVISVVIWLSGLYYYRPAAELSGSPWLASFGDANLPDDFVPTIVGAIAQGSWRTFIVGESYLDTSLWTMKYELHGSFLVFLAAPLFVYVLRGKFVWLLLLLSMTSILLIHGDTALILSNVPHVRGLVIAVFKNTNIYMIPFLCGLGIAYFERSISLPHSPWLTSALLVIGLYLLGFAFPDRHYSVFALLPGLHKGEPVFLPYQVVILSVGATVVIFAILRSPTAERIFGNEIGALLGRFSFPIYLVHVPVICSASSVAYVTTFPSLGRVAIYLAALCTIILTLAVALPLAKLDVAWVRFLNSMFTLRPALKPLTSE
jgi:peptidoglycan/LPS O-acetylase OafA/YrhL